MQAAGLSRFLVPVLMVLVLVLGATNVATVVSASSHNVAFGLIERALLIFGAKVAEAVLTRSPTREVDQRVREATARLENENKKLVLENKRIAAQNAEIEAKRAKVSADLDLEIRKRSANAGHVSDVASRVRKRLAWGLKRSMAAIPAEAVPYIGVGVTVAVAALEVHDACDTTKDLNGLLAQLGMTPMATNDVCGVNVPTVPEVMSRIQAQWRTSAEAVVLQAKEVSKSIPVPVVRVPTVNDAKTVICPVIGKTTWFPC